ncbi:ion transporter [Aestuariirhabdus litorea]|uniref:Ion transporter n=1 Tax=Aestuariirhabdus litorea TaxID=2528527 RepID=A0A3P3VMJ7_9GAMM|nr:ion transporter [Aestuariirhabdus litorea]RRJ83915.1 ion transporter [Aestuariirhabdus litorea]RWW97137.1 ion transporter [Endozoicomonadaceae bacterium GTF-13]
MATQRLKEHLYEVIFGTETPAGRRFDLFLIAAILLSIGVAMLDSVQEISSRYHQQFFIIEWVFTLLFTLEYIARLYCSPKPLSYARSFFGIVDLLAILPSYLALLYSGSTFLVIIRLLRVLRIFRILKLMRYLRDANVLWRSMLSSRRKIFVFFCSVLVLATIFGSLMYVVEGDKSGFTSIPKSIYWAIVTITTVGYGDITPHTVFGQVLASMVMVTGYSIIAVPTGIITAELADELRRDRSAKYCANCNRSGHDNDAEHCKYCGAGLNP